jgi:hypothetical protein
MYINPETQENYKFEYQPFIAGDTRTTTWELTVRDPKKDAYAELIFIDRAGNDTSIVIEYFATKMAIIPEKHDFGQLQKGDVEYKDFVVKNESETGEIKLTDLVLKSGDQGFRLINNESLPYILPPLGELPFRIEFTADNEGFFKDSIGIGDTCIFANYAYVEARVGSAEIMVSDHDFGDVTVGEKAEATLNIKSTGDADLIITGYRGPDNDVYNVIFDQEISQNNPLVISPDNSQNFEEFKVEFLPTAEVSYPDTIYFESNAGETVDNLAILNGRGIQAKLTANSEDWGRKRIHRDAFPAGPYPSENAIKLKNDGTEKVNISNINIEENVNGDAFIFDRDKLKNLTIQPKDSAFIPVEFKPVEPGQHRMVISYNNSADSDTRTILQGIGTIPRLSTENVTFERMIVGNNNNIQEKMVKFTTPGLDEWEYGDPLTITDLVVQPNGDEISTDGTNFGSQGFVFDKEAIDLPVVLNPGESIEFPARFLAQFSGDHDASVRAVSDAEQQNVVSNWHGFGVSEGIEGSGDNTEICVYETEILDCMIENTKEGEIEVYSVEIEPDYPEFSLADADLADGFILGSYESKEIKVEFAPLAPVDRQAELIIKNSTLQHSEIRIPIAGKSVHYDRATIGTVTKNDLVIGETIDYSINLDGTSDISMAQIKELDFTVEYENNFLKIDESSIKAGDLLDGKFTIENMQVTTVDAENFLKEITFTLKAIGDNILNGSGEIATMKFTAYLPSTSIDNKDAHISDSTTAINQTVNVVGSKCVDLTYSNTSVSLQPVCVYDLRLIAVSTDKFGLQEVRPNPIGPNGGEIEFSVGIPTYTEISIFDSEGRRVALPIAQKLDPGKYSVPVPINDLSSGVYYYKMVSGPYVESRQMVIVK